MKNHSLLGMAETEVFTPDTLRTLLNLSTKRLLACLLACCPAAYAEVLYEETFDRPVITTGLGITDSRLGWDVVVSAGANVFVQDLGSVLNGQYMGGSTANGVDGNNLFMRRFTPVTTGVVSLSCVARAHTTESISSCIGLTHQSYAGRQAQWTCVPGGWVFYIGRIDQTGEPYSDKPLGTPTTSMETVLIPSDIAVTLKIFIDMDRNKAWGVASWVDGAVPHSKTTAEFEWDAGLSNVCAVFVSQDRRDNKVGIDLDDIKVVGTPHVERPHPFLNTAHTIYQMNGTAGALPSTAQIQWISREWVDNGYMPYLAYMPEQSKLLLMYESGPTKTGYISSTDGGLTWGARTAITTTDPIALGLVYLGSGNLLALGQSTSDAQWVSSNYGSTWSKTSPSTVPSPEIYLWDPPAVMSANLNGTRNLICGGWARTGVAWESDAGPYSQGHKMFSTDSGATWSNPVSVPQWLGVNEVTITKAANGNLIAACRTDPPGRFRKTELDHYCGLAVSISSDNGATWSALNQLYTWGRQHASIVLLPNNDFLMTYVVRLGYTNDEAGFPRYGVEAILSHDNGVTWDLDHRIILAEWSGNLKGDTRWFGGVQSTSTVALPDGTIVTAFGVGFQNAPDTTQCMMDIALVRWQVPSNTLNNDTYLASFGPDSDGRNIINLKLPTGKKTISSPFSLGYGWKNDSWNTGETSSVNTPPGTGFSLDIDMAGMTGSNSGPSFTNRQLGPIVTGTSYQSAIVNGFDAILTAAYTASAPSDAAPNPNYQVGLNINAISMHVAPNLIEANKTANFYEEMPGYDLVQPPQRLVETAYFGTFAGWNKMAWDPVETANLAGPLTQTHTRTFKLEHNASYNVFIDGFEVAGNVGLTYDAVKPTTRKVISSTFSKGFGWNNNSWNTTETSSANTNPNASFSLNINFGSPGSITFSDTGPTFTGRILGYVSAGADYQSSYPAGFTATLSGGYVGNIPADAAGNPNYKIEIIVDSISVHSAPSTPSPTQTLALSETTAGHTQAQTPQYVTSTGNFLLLSNWKKFNWNPDDYLSTAGILRQTQSRSFTLTESVITALAIDGFEVSGRIELSYDAEP